MSGRRRRESTADEINRTYLVVLKREIEREKGIRVCIDCQPWIPDSEVIRLCPVHSATSELLEAAELALSVISFNGCNHAQDRAKQNQHKCRACKAVVLIETVKEKFRAAGVRS